MAKLIFTEEDERLIESLMEEFDPATHPISAPLADLLSAGEWERLSDALRSFIEAKIRTCMAARGFILALKDAGALENVAAREYLNSDIWAPNMGFGCEIPEEFMWRDFPLGPSGDWSLPADFTITAGEAIEQRFQSGLDFQPVS